MKYVRQANGISYDVYSLEIIIAIAFKIYNRESILFRWFVINEISATKRETPITLFVSCGRGSNLWYSWNLSRQSLKRLTSLTIIGRGTDQDHSSNFIKFFYGNKKKNQPSVNSKFRKSWKEWSARNPVTRHLWMTSTSVSVWNRTGRSKP